MSIDRRLLGFSVYGQGRALFCLSLRRLLFWRGMRGKRLYKPDISLDIERGNFKLFGLILLALS